MDFIVIAFANWAKASSNLYTELCTLLRILYFVVNFDDKNDVAVDAQKALGKKCPVCWKISTDPCKRHP